MENQIPFLGVGLSYRSILHDEIVRNRETIDFLEVIPDQFIYSNESSVAEILADLKAFPLVSHSVNLSIGTDAEIDADYLERVIDFIEKSGSICYSDHICFTRVPGIDLGQLSPLQFSQEIIDTVCRNTKKVLRELNGIPFYLENISYYLDVPGAEMAEAEFLSEIIEQSGCGMLLDINNLFVNSVNKNYDPYDFLNRIPLDKTHIVHIAGHQKQDGLLLDSHDAPLSKEVWKLLQYVVRHANIKAVLLEQDENLEDFGILLEQINKAREILNGAEIRVTA